MQRFSRQFMGILVVWWLMLAARGAQAQFVRDTYTDTAGTLLESHTGEVGATWAKNSSIGTGAAVITAAGRLRPNATSVNVNYYASGTPAAADYDVQADLVALSGLTANADYAEVVGRMNTGANTYYAAGYTGGAWIINKVVAGVQTPTTSGAVSLTVGSTYTMKLTIRTSGGNAFLTLLVNGVSTVTYTDTSPITAKGSAGVLFYTTTARTDATGPQMDNFVATDYAPGSATGTISANTTTSSSVLPQLAGITGGTAPYSVQFQRCASTNGTYTALGAAVTGVANAGTAVCPTADGGLSASTTYFYRAVTTDSAGTPMVTTLPSSSAGMGLSTSASSNSFLPNNAAIFWAPGVVAFDGSSFAHVLMNGTYFKTTFTGTSLVLNVSLATYTANAISTSSSIGYGHWIVQIDGGVVSDVLPTTSSITLATGLSNATHSMTAWFDLRDETDTFTPKDELIIQAFTLDTGAALSAPSGVGILRPKRAMIFGDSITKGYDALYPNSTSLNHPQVNYATTQLNGMNAEGGCVSYSGQGWVFNANNGPAASHLLPASFGSYSNGNARTLPALDYLFFCEGANDGGNNIQTAVQTMCSTARSAAGGNTWIFLCVPFGGSHRSEIVGGVAAYVAANPSDTKIKALDPTSVLALSAAMTIDGIHPLTPIHQQYGAILAIQARTAIDGAGVSRPLRPGTNGGAGN